MKKIHKLKIIYKKTTVLATNFTNFINSSSILQFLKISISCIIDKSTNERYQRVLMYNRQHPSVSEDSLLFMNEYTVRSGLRSQGLQG